MADKENPGQAFKVCSWCNSGSNLQYETPQTFCWTKMQTEAGQELDIILRRKELERKAGNNVFYWGIGNALGPNALQELIETSSIPIILFSVMRAVPKKEDVSPASLLLWTSFVDSEGRKRDLPTHALILSRGTTASGVKNRHYALVCSSSAPLVSATLGSIDISHLRNLGGNQGKLGYSQVTALVRHLGGTDRGPHYRVAIRAHLEDPYFVKLAEPRILRIEDHLKIEATIDSNPSATTWARFASELRARYRAFPN